MDYGQKLYHLTNGQTNEKFEEILHSLYGKGSDVWGSMLPVKTFLQPAETAAHALFELARTHWMTIHKANIFQFRQQQLDLHFINERLQAFFKEPSNRERLFHHAKMHGKVTFESLYHLIFERKVTFAQPVCNLLTIHVYQVGADYFIQPIFYRQLDFWQHVFAKKAYSIFMQQPLEHIAEPLKIMQQLHAALRHLKTKKQCTKILFKLTQQLVEMNTLSLALKQIEVFNVLVHFTGGARYVKKLPLIIEDMGTRWQEGDWCLTEQENALLAYLLMCAAYEQRRYEEVLQWGDWLLQGNRLFNHAVAILIEYEYFLASFNPEPDRLLKNDKANYLEYTFYMVFHAYVQLAKYKEARELLRQHESASCQLFYMYFHNTPQTASYEKLFKQQVRSDIQQLTQCEDAKAAIEVWQQQKYTTYGKITKTTSKKIMNMLKMAYMLGEEELFSLLYPSFKKYIALPRHQQELRRFMKKTSSMPTH